MRIDAFLHESPMFAVNRAARRFEALTAWVLAADSLGFLEGLVLAAMFFESPRLINPSQLAETFGCTREHVWCVPMTDPTAMPTEIAQQPAALRATLATLM